MSSTPFSLVSLDEACKLLRRGEVCAFGTETVYGLGADATNSEAVLKIYQAKNRPRFNPLIAHCADLEMAKSIATFDAVAEQLATLWPGALTLVLPLRQGASISDLVTAGLNTIGIRIPGHELARKLIACVGKPLAAPSANPSGKISPTSAQMVRDAFNDDVPVLDGGICQSGVESTILAVGQGQVTQLRAGALTRDKITRSTSIAIDLADHAAPVTAPGMLKSHYAPNAKLRLNAMRPNQGELYLGFGTHHDAAGLNLSPSGDLAEAARNLFAYLSELDAKGSATIAVAPIPDLGLGEAINDRLQRAAASRQ